MIIKPREIKSVLLFGGAGLVGYQIARQVAEYICPDTIVICSLKKEEAQEAAKKIKKEFPSIKNVKYEYGNLFIREPLATKDRSEISINEEYLNTVFNDTFEPINDELKNVGQQNKMVKIILKHKPNVVVDSINAATGISYQNVRTCSQVVKLFRDSLGEIINKKITDQDIKNAELGSKVAIEKLISYAKKIKNLALSPMAKFTGVDNLKMVDLLLISQAMPQLIRHVVLLARSLVAANTMMYIKVGTTGTGGMGMNIPYTHSEDKPSYTLLAKTAIAFAHTGLLFLLSRTPNYPVVKEIKPGAMIGYRKVDFRSVSGGKRAVRKWESKKEFLGKKLNLIEDSKTYYDYGDLKLVGVDTGENGFFTRAEFETITSVNSMEFVTPEEVARNVLVEMVGGNSGKDILAAINGSVMDSSYLSGNIRHYVIEEMLELEKRTKVPSLALGELGPPQLSKLICEAYLLQQKYLTIYNFAKDNISAEKLSHDLEEYLLKNHELQRIITSIGVPILLKNGKEILRGPKINIPENDISKNIDIESYKSIDCWAKQGWIDLRPNNMKVWQKRAKKMFASQSNSHVDGSARYHYTSYLKDEMNAGEVVGWIFANEFNGFRIK